MMIQFWKVIIAVFIVYSVAIHGKQSRRHRRQVLESSINPINQKQLPPPNPQSYNAQEQYFPPKNDNNEILSGRPMGRQNYPYKLNYGYGSAQGINYPYAGSGLGPYQYGYGQYGQFGQGSLQYASYYSNRNPGTYNLYPGLNSVGQYGANYYPSAGTNYYGGYFWNDAQKYNTAKLSLVLSLLFSSMIKLNL